MNDSIVTPTSRGTVIKKLTAQQYTVNFTYNDITNPNGTFANDIHEIHRHVGSHYESSTLINELVPNIEQIKKECEQEVLASLKKFQQRFKDAVDAQLPKTGMPADPKFIMAGAEPTLEYDFDTGECIIGEVILPIQYTISPYEEQPIQLIEHNG